MSKEPEKKIIPNSVKFLFGGLSGMLASSVVHPLDLIKNRMQIAKEKEYTSTINAITTIIRKEGFFALYSGLSASLMRQATYTTTRLGMYTWLFELASKDGQAPGFAAKAGLGMIAGVCGAFVGTPTEVALVRMTGDGRLPPNQRRNYKHVFDAIIRVVKEEGFSKLFIGVFPTMGRALIVNAAQLASYSQSKEFLLQTGYFSEGLNLQFGASMISGLVTTIAAMPVDIIKTRMQQMRFINGVPEYSGPADVILKILKHEGFFALWKGFIPYYLRTAPHTVLIFIFLEQFGTAYHKYVLKD